MAVTYYSNKMRIAQNCSIWKWFLWERNGCCGVDGCPTYEWTISRPWLEHMALYAKKERINMDDLTAVILCTFELLLSSLYFRKSFLVNISHILQVWKKQGIKGTLLDTFHMAGTKYQAMAFLLTRKEGVYCVYCGSQFWCIVHCEEENMLAGALDHCSCGICTWEIDFLKKNTDVPLVLSFLCSLGFQLMKLCQPYLGWVIPTQLKPFNLAHSSQTCPGTHFLGPSRTYEVDGQYHRDQVTQRPSVV